MAKIAFWGPIHGVGTTFNSIAVASAFGTQTSLKTLITHTEWAHSTLERAFSRNVLGMKKNVGHDTDIGMDALIRLAKSGKLQGNMIKDYTHPIVFNRLDLLYGTVKRNETEDVHGMLHILDHADVSYDCTIVDVNSAYMNNMTRSVLQGCDLIVISLNQNTALLDRFFMEREWNEVLASKPYLLVLGQYDKHIHHTYANIARKYKHKEGFLTIPRCHAWMNAYNESAVIDFFMRHRHVHKRNENYFFFKEVRKLLEHICEVAGVNIKMDVGQSVGGTA
ncbi:chromosome partitioning protein ParA [Longirhabdus pacifica]|uniref:chromosome partitioning protein ParA n=1 Tax=Longirhabdus pacifica TaxID=2305227 RepID=UPI001009202A|nr:chromosome partitioning protein ParA [Longirhabdus pacifica]